MEKKQKRILFICKKGKNFYSHSRHSSGLFNSTKFVSTALNTNPKFYTEVIEVNDNNDIDREVHKFKPNIVIIEAIWVVPEKFNILRKLHPKVKWLIHLHSNIPFLAMEGIATKWINEYQKLDIPIITNSYDAWCAIKNSIYLPNIYIANKDKKELFNLAYKIRNMGLGEVVKVGCFGAIRPLKNQLIQAMAAIEFCRYQNKKLEFHINATRVETGGDPILNSLRNLFSSFDDIKLVEHPWLDHDDFLDLLTQMDIGMQVSFTETFNIASADMVTVGLPIVVSKEINWVSRFCYADPTSIDDIFNKMCRVTTHRKLLTFINKIKLQRFSDKSLKRWIKIMEIL